MPRGRSQPSGPTSRRIAGTLSPGGIALASAIISSVMPMALRAVYGPGRKLQDIGVSPAVRSGNDAAAGKPFAVRRGPTPVNVARRVALETLGKRIAAGVRVDGRRKCVADGERHDSRHATLAA